MVTKVVMPRLSLTMKEGTVGKWYKSEGSTVEKGEPLVEIISEKATYDLESPAAGILRQILTGEGVDAAVDAVLAVITAEGEPMPEGEICTETSQTTVASETQIRVPASPAARRLAKELGIALSLVRGSGPEGRISEEDVRRTAEESNVSLPKVKQAIRLTGLRKISAERLSSSFRTAPHSTITMEVDMSTASKLRADLEVSHTAIIVGAVSKALRESEAINSTLAGEELRIYEDINIGVAAATENGLIVPVIRNADKKPLHEIDAVLKELTEKARQGKLTKDELSGGTFTVTNLGMYGVDFFASIINPPEAAILGVGRIADRPIVVEGKIAIKPVLVLSLTYDHRIVDGAPAAEFLRKVKQKIEKGAE